MEIRKSGVFIIMKKMKGGRCKLTVRINFITAVFFFRGFVLLPKIPIQANRKPAESLAGASLKTELLRSVSVVTNGKPMISVWCYLLVKNRPDRTEPTPTYPGLECSGTIEFVGKNVSCWNINDQVCALLSGGGYAEKVAVPAGQVFPVPSGVSLKDAASFPEVACTVWSTVFMTSRLSLGETFLIHGGSSGIGTFAIQMAKYQGARVFVTAGSEEKLTFCKDLGADVCINYKTEDFVAKVKEETGGKGVDVILDNIGGPYFQRNLDSLTVDGRLFIIGFMGGVVTQVNLACLLGRRLTVQAAGLRTRSLENKAAIVTDVEKNVWPAIEVGKVKPVVYKHFPLSEAAEARRLMESSKHIGKIMLIP